MARASERRGLSRRRFLAVAAGASLSLLLGPTRRARAAPLSAEVVALLEKSGFVYVSPLLRSGAESRCHGEVWFGWLDGGVVLITAKDTWKARALGRGLDRARIWVGDHGRVGRILGSGDAFRRAPSFEARARQEREPALLDGLMTTFRRKYPGEIGSWEGRMRAGFESGERILIRYTPG